MGLWARLTGREQRFVATSAPSYRNSAVIDRIVKEEGVDRDIAIAWFNEMLIFLDLCAASEKMLSPSKPVDAAWHAFLLHTRDYDAYCNERFGRVIHHQPTGKPDPKAYARAHSARGAYSHRPGFDPAIWAPAVVGGALLADAAAAQAAEAGAGGAGAAVGDGMGESQGDKKDEDNRDSAGGGAGGGACGGGGGAGESGSPGDYGGGDSGGSSDSGGGSSCSSGSSCGGSSCGGGG